MQRMVKAKYLFFIQFKPDLRNHRDYVFSSRKNLYTTLIEAFYINSNINFPENLRYSVFIHRILVIKRFTIVIMPEIF